MKKILISAFHYLLALILLCLSCPAYFAQGISTRWRGVELNFASIPVLSKGIASDLSESRILEIKQDFESSLRIRAWTDELRSNLLAGNIPDWCIPQIIDSLIPIENEPTKMIFNYVVLEDLGFCPKLFFKNGALALGVWSNDLMPDLAFFESEGKRFYLLAGKRGTYSSSFSSDSFIKKRRSFSFVSNKIPNFAEECIACDSISFLFSGDSRAQIHLIKFCVSQSWVEFLKFCPKPDVDQMTKIPVSRYVYESLINNLKSSLPLQDQVQTLNYLLALCSLGLPYGEDETAKGEDQYLSPEETLVADHSDCEDKTFLFVYLVKKLLKLNVILLSYEEHMAAAVDLKHDIGKVISHNNKTYSVCDPTGTSSRSYRVGELDVEYSNSEYTVVQPEW
jgi:hypothetical protein